MLVLLKVMPITMSGGDFFSSVGRLEDILIKLITTANMYPILNESFITIIEEKSEVHLNLGELSKEQLFELLRSNYFPEDYNVGKYVLSWLIMSLTSLVDRYFDDIIDDVNLKSLEKGSKKNINEKKRILLKEIGLWDEFLDKKPIMINLRPFSFNLWISGMSSRTTPSLLIGLKNWPTEIY